MRMRGRKLPVEADELCLVAGVRVTMVEEITVPKYGQTLGRNGKLQALLYLILFVGLALAVMISPRTASFRLKQPTRMVTLAKQEPVGTEQSLVGTMSE